MSQSVADKISSLPISRVIGAAVVAVIAAAVATAIIFVQATYFRPTNLTLGPTFSGYTRVDSSASTDLERYGKTWAATDGNEPDMENMYFNQRDAFHVYLTGRSGYIMNTRTVIDDGFSGWSEDIVFTDSKESVGDRDLYSRCAVGKPVTTRTDNLVPVVFCAWADRGGYMVAIFDHLSLETAMYALTDIRTAIAS